jgi:ubiquinone/menaquinone biosynthesis C-methylase UbiE
MNLNDKRLVEQKKYEWLSDTNRSYGGTNHGKTHLSYILNKCKFPLLDIGCGRNNFVKSIKEKKSDIYAIGLDFAFKEADIISSANNIPSDNNFFNTITAFDFFEHLLLEDIPLVIKEIVRISKNGSQIFATISHVDSINRGPNGETLHPTVKDINWWLNMFKKNNISIQRNHSKLYEGIIIK